jgi:hypothetical protein
MRPHKPPQRPQLAGNHDQPKTSARNGISRPPERNRRKLPHAVVFEEENIHELDSALDLGKI